LGRDLPRPRHAYREALGQLLQRSVPTVIGLQQLAPQIVPIPFRHCWFAAESCRNPVYTYGENALEGVTSAGTDVQGFALLAFKVLPF
jgi:hypothetical protein